ncbi:MAG: M56 family metallopeptidase [Oscillospiraceae bacterium]|nr:M56 family metallopeptidase [Oscillospiraceae bacterium]
MADRLFDLLSISLFLLPLILLAVLFAPTWRKKCAPLFGCAVWLILALRLCLPVQFSLSSAPIQIAMPDFWEEELRFEKTSETSSLPEEESSFFREISSAPILEDTSLPLYPDEEGPSDILEETSDHLPKEEKSYEEPLILPSAGGSMVMPPLKLSHRVSITGWQLVFGFWALGAAAFFAWHLIDYGIFRRKMLKNGRPAEKAELDSLSEATAQLGYQEKKVRLMFSKEAESPMAFGFFHPVILLPDRRFEKEERLLILSHELVHLYRGDLYYKAFLLLANGLHWFNPAAWLLFREGAKELELACDADVLRRLGSEWRRKYSEAILNTIAVGKNKNVLASNFYSGRKGMKERFDRIWDRKPKKSGLLLLLCLLLVLTCLSTMIACDSGLQPPLGNESSSLAETSSVPEKSSALEEKSSEPVSEANSENVPQIPYPQPLEKADPTLLKFLKWADAHPGLEFLMSDADIEISEDERRTYLLVYLSCYGETRGYYTKEEIDRASMNLFGTKTTFTSKEGILAVDAEGNVEVLGGRGYNRNMLLLYEKEKQKDGSTLFWFYHFGPYYYYTLDGEEIEERIDALTRLEFPYAPKEVLQIRAFEKTDEKGNFYLQILSIGKMSLADAGITDHYPVYQTPAEELSSKPVSEPVSEEEFSFVERECVNWKQKTALSDGMSPYHYIFNPSAVTGNDVLDNLELNDVDYDAITKQISEYNNSILDDQTDNPPYDLTHQLKMYGITKEEFIKLNDDVVALFGDEKYRPFSNEEVELIYGDYNAFLQYFKSDKALYHNGRIYAPAWFAKHPLEDWIAEEFDKQDLLDYFTENILNMYWEENRTIVYDRLRAYPED